MGRAVRSVLDEHADAQVWGKYDRDGALPEDADVVIDFSLPGGARDALAWAVENNVPLVSGTTGVGDDYFDALDEAATRIAVLHATNMSVGVAVLRALTRLAAAVLPAEFQPELTEVHHRHKRDAPSGTANSLIEDVIGARPELRVRAGRDGDVGPRAADELGVHALRGGDVVGIHRLHFFGDGEHIELAHTATDRMIFARGAVLAAVWLFGRGPGRYSIDDVLGLAR